MGTIPTVPTYTALSVLTAANLNSLGTAVTYLYNAPKCYAYQTATTTFGTSGTYALVGLDTELYDTDGPGSAAALHDTVTNNSRIVCQTAGKYRISGQVAFATNVTGSRFLSLRKNSGGAIGGGTQLAIAAVPTANGGSTPVPFEPFIVPLSVSDYVEMFGMQTSGGSLASVATQAGTFLQIEFVSA